MTTGCCLPPTSAKPGRPVLDAVRFTAPDRPAVLVLSDGSRRCADCRRSFEDRPDCADCENRQDAAR